MGNTVIWLLLLYHYNTNPIIINIMCYVIHVLRFKTVRVPTVSRARSDFNFITIMPHKCLIPHVNHHKTRCRRNQLNTAQFICNNSVVCKLTRSVVTVVGASGYIIIIIIICCLLYIMYIYLYVFGFEIQRHLEIDHCIHGASQ